jgi:vancomycin resistance protein YoaR
MEGRHEEKKPGRAKRGWLAAGTTAGILIAAYLGLCAWVGTSDKILPHVSVAGVDVSGMTVEQAQRTVEQALETYGAGAAVTLRYQGWSGTLPCADVVLSQDTDDLVAKEAERGSFLTNGVRYLSHLLGFSTQVGLELTLADGQPALENLLEQAEQRLGHGEVQTTYQVEGDRLVVTKGVTGQSFDLERVRAAVAEAVDQALEESVAQKKAANVQLDLTDRDVVVEKPLQDPDFDAIYQSVYTEAQSAAFDPDTNQITDHVVGVDFDEQTLERDYAAAQEGATFSIPLTLTQPKDTKASLESKLFRDVLGKGTTKVSGSANRKSNVKLSAAACDGVILMPGEVFSYNGTTGSRTAEKGYLEAPVYSGGASVDEVGGGICQTSSTIYYAVLHTNLEIVERAAHRYNTGYVDPGMDATVYYGSTDFRFKNSTDYPIKLVTESYDSNGARYLTVKIYGTNEDGVYAVPKSTVTDKIAPTTQYQADTSIPEGTTKVDTKQNPYTGLTAQTYRYVYDKDGNLLETQDMGISKYKMRPKTILYNPADGDPSTWPNGVPPVKEEKPAESQTTVTEEQTGSQTDSTAAADGTSGDQAAAELEQANGGD